MSLAWTDCHKEGTPGMNAEFCGKTYHERLTHALDEDSFIITESI